MSVLSSRSTYKLRCASKQLEMEPRNHACGTPQCRSRCSGEQDSGLNTGTTPAVYHSGGAGTVAMRDHSEAGSPRTVQVCLLMESLQQQHEGAGQRDIVTQQGTQMKGQWLSQALGAYCLGLRLCAILCLAPSLEPRRQLVLKLQCALQSLHNTTQHKAQQPQVTHVCLRDKAESKAE